MKLTLILIAATFLQVSAKTYAQQVTLKVKKASLKEVFQKIQLQTNYDFLYNADDLKFAKTVSLDFKNTALKQVLDECFNNQQLTYVIENTTILITKKPAPVLEKFVDKAITGKVTDASNLPLPGVVVREKGTQNFVATDITGSFKITVANEKAILVFSSVGFTAQEIPVGSSGQLNVILKEKTQALNDVVVIGYGSQRRGDLNGAISSVTAKDIENVPQVSVDQLLQGRAAGVTVTQGTGAPGSAASVHIRGVGSLTGSNEPLYVIDGIEISGDANNYAGSGRQANQYTNGENSVSPLSLINPNDIASIDVLKDASATAIYGSRASNGVIIITTKRGKKGSAHLDYDGYYGFQQQGKFLKMMNLVQYADLENKLADIYQVGRRGEFSDPSILGPGTDWQKEVFKTSPMESHQISVSGGNDGSDYYLSGGYLKQDGTILGSNFKRYSFRSNVNGQIRDWLKLGENVFLSRTIENQGLSDNGGIVYNALLSAPDQAVRNPDGSFAGPQPNQLYGTLNPVAQALQRTNNLVRNEVNANFYADLRFIKDLTLRSELGGDFNFADSKQFNPSYVYGILTNPTATLSDSWQQGLYWSWKEYFTYNHTFGKKLNLNSTLGHEVSESNWNGISGSRQTFFSNDLQTLNLGDAKSAKNDEYKGSSVLESAFFRAIINYDNKYSITATIRSDKSSNFAPGHQTGYFPSVAASWRISEEPFMASFKKIADNVKLRVSWGETGNQDIPGYQYGAALNPVVTGLGTGFFIDKYPNENVKWQTSLQTDVGLDFSLLGRIDVAIDWYDKTSKNFLFQQPIPQFLSGDATYLGGIAPRYVNGGKVDNKGIEFTINSRNIVTKDFNWTSTVTFTHYTNKVISLVGTQPITASVTGGFIPTTVTQTVAGQPIGEFYGYKVKGIFKTEDQLRNAPLQFGQPVANNAGGTWLGDIQYVDVNHDGKIDEGDRTYLGNPQPKFNYGFSNTFTYKSFDLTIFLQGVYGSKVLNFLNYEIGGLNSLYVNQLASSANYWSPSNPNSNIPAPKGGENHNLEMSDRFLQSGSYLRVQNVKVGYTLPDRWVKKINLNHLRVFASGQNLFVITGYKGLDPEVGEQNQNVFLTNIDLGRYPSPRTITFGIDAQF